MKNRTEYKCSAVTLLKRLDDGPKEIGNKSRQKRSMNSTIDQNSSKKHVIDQISDQDKRFNWNHEAARSIKQRLNSSEI